jgi:hypothetical protein
MDNYNQLLEKLADELVEMHNATGIELEQWDTAYKFVKNFYNTEEQVQIRILTKKKNDNEDTTCTNCGNDSGPYALCLDCLNLIECNCKGN